jgi:nucleotide-binding universal stress UspA family protein
VGYDFFPESHIALLAAQMIAGRTAAVMQLAHVVEPSPTYTYKLLLSERAAPEDIATQLQLELHALVKSPALTSASVETSVVIGKPFLELLKLSKEWRADLVVVGVSPPGAERFLGSTAERLVRKSPVTVLVVKQELTQEPKTILVPTDFSPCARHAAEQALALAQLFGSTIVFLHVVDRSTRHLVGHGSSPVLPSLLAPRELEAEWEGFLQQVPRPDTVTWERQTQEGRAAQTIAQMAKERAVDLVVMGTHGRSEMIGMLIGSVAEKVVRLTDCSVMTVRPKAFRLHLP